MTVLITGAAGFVGRAVVRGLAEAAGPLTIVATDVRELPASELPHGIDSARLDVTDAGAVRETFERYAVDTVVHLAAIVTPPRGDTRALQHRVDVQGTRNVLEACVATGVSRLVYTSSGAAYGYDAANSPLLDEDDPLRGNEVFAYAWHKRLVEEELARYREEHPALEQVIFRVSTVLGSSVDNQITALFERPVVVGLKGVDTPFCFAWDEDVARCIVAGACGGKPGIYNLTGDGAMTLREIAHGMGRRFVALPEWAVRAALDVLNRHGLSPYGPEQVLFLRHRPVMSNRRLEREFGYKPTLSSRQVFELYRDSRSVLGQVRVGLRG